MFSTIILYALSKQSIFILLFTFLVLIYKGIKSHAKLNKNWLLLLLFIFGNILSSIAWTLVSYNMLYFRVIPKNLITLFFNISWIFYIAGTQSVSLFVENIFPRVNIDKFSLSNLKAINHNNCRKKISLHQKITIVISSLLILLFLLAQSGLSNCSHLRFIFQELVPLYLCFVVILPTLWKAIHKIRNIKIEQKVKDQIKIAIHYIMLPYLMSGIINHLLTLTNSRHLYLVISISNYVAYVLFAHAAGRITRVILNERPLWDALKDLMRKIVYND
ncbi:hypothetical protein ACFLYU_03645 [Candidatus Dependentiae bacterium]